MDSFYHEETNFEALEEQNELANIDFTRNQTDNIFGIDFKENMFEDPWTISVQIPEEPEKEPFYEQISSQCISEGTTLTIPLNKTQEHPPCRCYRINCQKKYCECFRNGRKCTKKCICIDCHNQPIVTRLKVNVEDLWQVSYMFNNIKRGK